MKTVAAHLSPPLFRIATMNLPTDVKRSLERLKTMAVLDELRQVTEMLQENGFSDAALRVAARADQLSKQADVVRLAPANSKKGAATYA
jgi:hypothetical protein